MKLLSPLAHKKARIEIIPLIDIMFFLLACMMLISLNMIQMKGVKLNLPTATTATAENKSDFLTLSVRKEGTIFLDKVEIERTALVDELKKRKTRFADLHPRGCRSTAWRHHRRARSGALGGHPESRFPNKAGHEYWRDH